MQQWCEKVDTLEKVVIFIGIAVIAVFLMVVAGLIRKERPKMNERIAKRLLEYLCQRETILALKSIRTSDPDANKIAATGGLDEIRAVKNVLTDLMKQPSLSIEESYPD